MKTLRFVILALAIASSAQAQNWTESGDAGDGIATAQATAGNGPLQSIDGTLASPTDVDLYCIQLVAVPPVSLPLVQLQCSVMNGPNVRLFDASGNGVFINETCAFGNKSILAPALFPAGTYYVAVSYSGFEALSAGGKIWLAGLPGQRAPDGPGAGGTLTAWAGTPDVQPINPYHLSLSFMGYCEQPTPTLPATWGALKVHYTR